jgi:hypothetical protein
VILGAALVTVLLPSFCGPSKGAYEAVLRANLHTIRDVIGQYHVDRGRYPNDRPLAIL